MKPKINGHRGRSRVHSRDAREGRRITALERTEAYAKRSVSEQLELVKSRRGNSVKEVTRLEARLAGQVKGDTGSD